MAFDFCPDNYTFLNDDEFDNFELSIPIMGPEFDFSPEGMSLDEIFKRLNRGYYVDTSGYDDSYMPKQNKVVIEDKKPRLWFENQLQETKPVSNLSRLIEDAKKALRAKASSLKLSAESDQPHMLFADSGTIQEKKAGPFHTVSNNHDVSSVDVDVIGKIHEKKSDLDQTISKKDDVSRFDAIKSVSLTTPVNMLEKKKVVSCHTEEETKLECSKRKLKERYSEVESAKKKRRIQVIEYLPSDREVMNKAPVVKKKKQDISKARRSKISVPRMKLDRAILFN